MEARRAGLHEVLRIQRAINSAARQAKRPFIQLINRREYLRIQELMEANTWPEGWTGHEVRGDVLLPQVLADGVVQPLLEEDFL